MGTLTSVLVLWAFAASIMLVFFLIQLRTRDATLVDVVWAGGLALVACFYAATGTGDAGRRVLLAILGGL